MAHDDPSSAADAADVQRFWRGSTSRHENRELVRRRLLGEAGSELGATGLAAVDETALAAVFERLGDRLGEAERRLDVEGRDAEAFVAALAQELERRPLSDVRSRLADDPQASTWALSEALRRRSFAAGLERPEHGVDLARLALDAAELAAPRLESGRLGHDLRAAAHGQLGNALRIASRHRAAAAELGRARQEIELGTGDPLLRARLASFEASLLSDRSELRDAILRCRRAGRLLRRAGDAHGHGRVLLQEADLHARDGDLPAAIDCLRAARQRIDANTEPRLSLVALHNLIFYLDLAGHTTEAWGQLDEAKRLAQRLGHRLDLVRLLWLEGTVAAHRGEAKRAESCWTRARGAFVELGVAFDAALVSLDLAGLHAAQGRWAQLRELAEEMVPVFRSEDLRREAQAALELFYEAVQAETAGVELVREVVARLEATRPRRPLAVDPTF